ncbi:hypothetical protein KKG41_00530 [Patescibacteria group bacterium]|nr:hypothetical protein [Patescibacteria group bacterium]MBU1890708.1 hypothetical protein [Patescibacteria group bacterium]
MNSTEGYDTKGEKESVLGIIAMVWTLVSVLLGVVNLVMLVLSWLRVITLDPVKVLVSYSWPAWILWIVYLVVLAFIVYYNEQVFQEINWGDYSRWVRLLIWKAWLIGNILITLVCVYLWLRQIPDSISYGWIIPITGFAAVSWVLFGSFSLIWRQIFKKRK